MSHRISWMDLKMAAPQESWTTHPTLQVRREMRYKAVLVGTVCFEMAAN